MARTSAVTNYCSLFEQTRCHETLEKNKATGTEYSVVVVLPADYDPARTYKYLLVTDIHRNLKLTEAALRSLDGVIEPLILIGVGSPKTSSETVIGARRTFDFTDPQFLPRSDLSEVLTEICQADHRQPDRCIGGAPEFHRWLTSDLLPRLAQRFKLATDGNALVGTSAGGYFVVLAATRYPGGFSRYIATSPALGYGATLLDNSPKPTSHHGELYVAIGSLEAQSSFLTGPADVTGGFDRLKRFVARQPAATPRSHFERIDGYGHGDVVVPALIKALRSFYTTPPSDQE